MFVSGKLSTAKVPVSAFRAVEEAVVELWDKYGDPASADGAPSRAPVAVPEAARALVSATASQSLSDYVARQRASLLARECWRSAGAFEGSVELSVRPRAGGAKRASGASRTSPQMAFPRVTARPKAGAFARCLVERGPVHFRGHRASVSSELTTKPTSLMSPVSFAIVGTYESFSAGNFSADKRGLARLEERLGLQRDADEVYSDGKGGLTFSEEHCAAGRFVHPCYVARGRWDHGAYLSIELSDTYDGFARGRFVVIAASGDKDSAEFRAVVEKAKAAGVAVYVKEAEVYLGCMH